jgi:hypothetical protein
MRPAHLIITAALGLVAPTIARAQSDAVLVYGTAKPHARQLVADAVTRTVGQASWSVARAPFTTMETTNIIACLGFDRPWPCMAPIANTKRIGRVVMVEVDPDGSSLVLIGQVLLESNAVPSLERRFCDPCTDQTLAQSAQDLTTALLERTIARAGNTAIEIRTTPPGASIAIDGTWTGTSDTTITVPPGTHQVQIQRSGYRPFSEQVVTAEGRTTKLAARLVASDPVLADRGDQPSHVLPLVVGGAGAAALIGGSVYSLTRDPPRSTEQPKYVYSGPAIVVAAAGGIAVGIGAYLWFHPPRGRSTPIAQYVPHGALVGWTAGF